MEDKKMFSEEEFWNDYSLVWDVDNTGNFIFFDRKYKWLLQQMDYSIFITLSNNGDLV